MPLFLKKGMEGKKNQKSKSKLELKISLRCLQITIFSKKGIQWNLEPVSSEIFLWEFRKIIIILFLIIYCISKKNIFNNNKLLKMTIIKKRKYYNKSEILITQIYIYI